MKKLPLFPLAAASLMLAVTAACGGGGTTSPPARTGRAPQPGEIVINEFLADPASDANCDGTINTAQDEFIELVSSTTDTLDLSNVTISDAALLKHTFPVGAYLPPLIAVVVYGGGSPNCTVPADVAVSVASTGSLGLNNAGDTITVKDETGTIIDTMTYNSSTNDVSWNILPEGAPGGTYYLHSSISSSNYSPGVGTNGLPFP